MFVFSAVLIRNVHISKNQFAIVLDLGWIHRAGLYVRKLNALLFSAFWDRKSLFWLASWVEKSSALVSSFPYYGPFGKWRKLFIKAVCHRVFITFTLYYVRPRDLEFGLVPTYAYMNLQYDMFWLNVVVCSNSDFSFISQVIDICLQKWKNFRFNLFEISF